MAIESDDPATGELPRVSSDDTGGRLMRVRTRDSGWGKYRARIANWAADGLARREHLPAPYGHRPSLPCGRTLIIGSSHRLPLPILGASY